MRKRMCIAESVCVTAVITVVISLAVAGSAPSAEQTAQEIQHAIAEAGAEWTAGVTWVSQLSPEERAALCGTILERIPDEKKMSIPVSVSPRALPTHFDWHDNVGDWMSPVRNQGACGSCWDFSAIGVFEALLNIAAGNPALDPDLSEQYVLSCCLSCGDCDGGWPYRAFDFCVTTGTVDEPCLVYQADDTVPCEDVCGTPTYHYLGDWAFIYETVASFKQAIYTYGPISACFEVYDDFYSYTGGVYEHVWGDYSGGHAIVVVGWDDAEQCWICKNSWGPSWGESGFFRIRWGECGIQDYSTSMATLTSWPSGVVNLTVLDYAGTGLAGVDVYLNDDWVGVTGAGGTLALDLTAGMYYDIVAISDDAHLLLYDGATAPGSLVLDCRDASYVTVDAFKRDSSPLDAWLRFEVGPNRRLYSPEHTSGGDGWFYITPGVYNVYAWSTYDEVELYDLYFPDVNLSTSTSMTIDASAMPTTRWTLDTLAGPYEALCLSGWSSERWWAVGWWLGAGDRLVIEAGEWNRYSELIDIATTSYEWYYYGSLGSYSLVGGEEIHLSAGGDLTLSTWPEEPVYMPGDATRILTVLTDDYGNSYYDIDRLDPSTSLPPATVMMRPDDVTDPPVRSDAPGDTWADFDPWLTVTPPTGPAIFDDEIYQLENWVWIDLDPAAELGAYNVRATLPSHLGELEALSSFVVTGSPAVFRVDSTGNVLADEAFYGASFETGAADVAEWVQVSEPVEAGDVLELDPENPQHYRKTTGSCSSLVAGVVSTQPGVTLGSNPLDFGPRTDDSRLATEDSALLALIGIVPVKACDEGGPIELGDLLVTASIPGYAKKWNAECGVGCPLIGKALEEMNEGTGMIDMLLMR